MKVNWAYHCWRQVHNECVQWCEWQLQLSRHLDRQLHLWVVGLKRSQVEDTCRQVSTAFSHVICSIISHMSSIILAKQVVPEHGSFIHFTKPQILLKYFHQWSTWRTVPNCKYPRIIYNLNIETFFWPQKTNKRHIQPKHFPDHVSSNLVQQVTTKTPDVSQYLQPTLNNLRILFFVKTMVDWNQFNDSQVQTETINNFIRPIYGSNTQ